MAQNQVGKKILVSDIFESECIKTVQDYNLLKTKYGEVSIVNVMGIIVSISDNTFLIDDGTGSIQIRYYGSKFSSQKIGNLVNVVGRVREWENTKYITPIAVSIVSDKKWFQVHQLVIKLQNQHPQKKMNNEAEKTEGYLLGPHQQIINAILSQDKGDGADINTIIDTLKIDGCEEIITALIEAGEIFELVPGRVKVLE